MDKIILQNGVTIGILFDKDQQIEHQVESLVKHLDCEIELAAGTTLRHLWQYIEQDVEFFNLVFARALGYHQLNTFVSQSKQTPNEEENDTENIMLGLEVCWTASIYEGTLEIATEFVGYGTSKVRDPGGNESIIECKYAVDLSPINDLLDYRLRLNDEITLHDKQKLSRQKTTKKQIWQGKKKWTVYELLYAIFEEISFHGTPKDQLRRLADLDQRLASAKDYINEDKINKENNDV